MLLPEDAHWLADLHRELTLFPNGRHDDQVDSLSQFLAWARERSAINASTIILGPRLMSMGGGGWDDAPD